jgi:hypothetical protein
MSELSIGAQVVAELTGEVALHGAGNAETGGFLHSHSQARGHIDVLALADSAGVRRARDLFALSAAAIERLFSWAGERDLAIRAQVHSHRAAAILSTTDVRHGFAVEGFISAVIPDYRHPAPDPLRWGWWRCDAGRWTPIGGPRVARDTAVTVRFDEDGVRER